MLDFKTHIPSVFPARAVANCHAYVLFLTRLVEAALEFVQPALDFSHSNPAFCHPISREKSMQLAHLMSKSSMKAAAGKVWTLPLMDAAIGGLVCALAAVALSAAANGHAWKNMAPLIFTVVLLIIAGLFGSRAGIIGTVVAAMIFAGFLFNPMGNIQVADETARGNLGWMMLIGIGFSFLFAPPSSGIRRH
jgi:K+-sensing histidine kinase KdpD